MGLSVKILSTPQQVIATAETKSTALTLRPRSLHKFGYAAGNNNRLNSDWRLSSVGPNHDLRFALETVRNRARDLVNNDDYARGYMRQMQANVVGPFGFSPKLNPSDRDKKFRENAKRIRDKFFEWSEAQHCSYTGEEEFIDIQNMLIAYAPRDGEFCLRIIRNKKMKFGFALQVMQVELLDETYNEILSKDRVVVLGIEYDRATWKRTAYYFKDIPIESQVYGYINSVGKRIRIPAEDIIHGYLKEYQNQSRGISWMVQTMSAMKMLNAYDEATLVNARFRASTGGFLSPDKDAPGMMSELGDSEDGEGNMVWEIENGTWKLLPKGVTPTFMDNNFPANQYPDYVGQNLRRQSVGLGVAGSVHSGNYSDVNFSSERARQIAIRDNYMLIQEWLIRRALKPIGRIFLKEALFTGQIDYPYEQFERYARMLWTGRRWAYVNPEQEMNANMMKWSLKTKSVSQMILESDDNLEPEEVFQQIQEDLEMAKQYGFTITTDIKQPTAPVENPKPAPAAPKKEEKSKTSVLVDSNGHLTNGHKEQ